LRRRLILHGGGPNRCGGLSTIGKVAERDGSRLTRCRAFAVRPLGNVAEPVSAVIDPQGLSSFATARNVRMVGQRFSKFADGNEWAAFAWASAAGVYNFALAMQLGDARPAAVEVRHAERAGDFIAGHSVLAQTGQRENLLAD
jgi:hypothetical protein